MHTETRALLFGVHTDIPGRTQQPNLFPLGFTQISLGAHSNPISFLGGIHTDIPGPRQQPDLFFFFFFFGIHTDIPGRTQQPDLSFFFLFFLGFTQISLGAHSNTISLVFFSFFFFFLGFTQISLGAHSNPISLFFFFSCFLGFTQISLGAHSNPISFLWDSHRYPWAHTATQSLLVGIHTDIPGRTQQPDLFSLGFTQISLGAHSNPISLFFFFFFFFLFFLGFTQISLGTHSNPISFLWDSHRYPWAHTATQSLFFFLFFFFFWDSHRYPWAHTATQSLFFFFFLVFWDSHRYPWAHTATRSLFFGIHTDIPGRTQQPNLFSLGFTQISLGAHSNPISFLWDSHRYPWAHTATQSLFFFFFFFLFFWDSHRYPWAHTATRSLFFGIHTDIPGRTQQPNLFSLGFTQISLGAHSNPISLFFSFFFFFFLGFTQISLGAHSNPISFLWDSHRFPWAHTATRSLLVGIHTDIYGRTQQPDLFSLGFTQISPGGKNSNPSSSRWDSHRYPWAHTATQTLLVGIHTQISLGHTETLP